MAIRDPGFERLIRRKGVETTGTLRLRGPTPLLSARRRCGQQLTGATKGSPLLSGEKRRPGLPAWGGGSRGQCLRHRDTAAEIARGRQGIWVKQELQDVREGCLPGRGRLKRWVPLPASGHVGEEDEDGVKDQGFHALTSGS